MKKTKLLAVLMLLVVMVVGASIGVFANGQDNTGNGDSWTVSKSKTAERVAADQWDVTLSLPAADVKTKADVVLVADVSSSMKDEDIAEAKAAVEELCDILAAKTNVDVKVGIVTFDKTAHNLTDGLVSVADAKAAAENIEASNDTNMMAGLMAGKAMLDADTDVAAEDKYMVLLSDGIPIYWMEDGEPHSKTLIRYAQDGTTELGRGPAGSEPEGSLPDASQVKEIETILGWTDWDVDSDEWKQISDTGENINSDCLHTNIEKSIYKTATYLQDNIFNKYNLVTVAYGVDKYENNAVYTYGEKFCDWIGKYSDYYAKVSKAGYGGETGDLSDAFDSIANEVINLLGPGSRVVDTMGDNVDLVVNEQDVADTFTLTEKIGEEAAVTLEGTYDAESKTITYSDNEGNDLYTIVLGDNSYTWNINKAITKNDKVTLTYTVALKGSEGGVFTADITEEPTVFENTVDANQSAILNAKDTQGNPSATDDPFEKPQLSYETGVLKVSHAYFEGTPDDLKTLDLPADTYSKAMITDFSEVKYSPDQLGAPIDSDTLAENRFALYRIVVVYPEDSGLENQTFETAEAFNEAVKDGIVAKTGLTKVTYIYNSLPRLNKGDHFSYIIGYPDGTVRPQGQITRAEVAAIFFRLLEDDSRMAYWDEGAAYSDIKAEDWYSTEVATLVKAGIITGYPDGTFRGDNPITRAELATIATRFDKLTEGDASFSDIDGHWAEDYIIFAATKGWVNGYPDGTFKPDQMITRAETMMLINNVLERLVLPAGLGDFEDMVVWPDNVLKSVDEDGQPDPWYYTAVQEATNSHLYQREEGQVYETWTKIEPAKDWNALEKEWSEQVKQIQTNLFAY